MTGWKRTWCRLRDRVNKKAPDACLGMIRGKGRLLCTIKTMSIESTRIWQCSGDMLMDQLSRAMEARGESINAFEEWPSGSVLCPEAWVAGVSLQVERQGPTIAERFQECHARSPHHRNMVEALARSEHPVPGRALTFWMWTTEERRRWRNWRLTSADCPIQWKLRQVVVGGISCLYTRREWQTA